MPAMPLSCKTLTTTQQFWVSPVCKGNVALLRMMFARSSLNFWYKATLPTRSRLPDPGTCRRHTKLVNYLKLRFFYRTQPLDHLHLSIGIIDPANRSIGLRQKVVSHRVARVHLLGALKVH